MIVIACSLFCLFLAKAVAKYSLLHEWNAKSNFFESFEFFTDVDPTNGYVDYVDESTAKSLGLVKYMDNQVYLGVDSTTIPNSGSRGRKSVRLTSKVALNGSKLVVVDLEHMPSTVGDAGLPKGCSLWPAFWMFGKDWPADGEIDIVEFVNTDSKVATTLHTTDNCTQANEATSLFSGKWAFNPITKGVNDNCYNATKDQYPNVGCSIVGPDNAVGSSFNANGMKGGAFVMEWNVEELFIRTFYFPRNVIPADLAAKQPDPDNWGLPYAHFSLAPGVCDKSHFRNLNVVFNTAFCGQWAGEPNLFRAACSTTVTCTDFVKNNPTEFVDAYWLINFVDVYDNNVIAASFEVNNEEL